MKPTIEQALASKLPLPWKTKSCDGTPAWAVIRQRAEDLTAEKYDRLKKYGCKDDTIRELFYAGPGAWAALKLTKGIVTPHGVKAHEKVEAAKPAPVGPAPSRLEATPPEQLKKIEMADAEIKPAPPTVPPFRAHNYPDPDGLNYADRHCLGIDAPHTPTPAELTEIFEPEPPVGLLQTAERLADLVKQREYLRQERELVQGMLGKIDASIEECLKIIQEAAR